LIKVIYDLGANNGDDIAYYLKKADKIVAVEANPALCHQIALRYSDEIQAGRILIECCVLTNRREHGDVSFYLHKHHNVLSQFPPPTDLAAFEKVMLPSKSIIDLIAVHGAPYYLKSDIENYDGEILKALFEHQIFPEFISAEAHTVEIFALLLTLGSYSAFKLVDGYTVPRQYANHAIVTSAGSEMYSFPAHSAGPFGEDIKGPWLAPDSFLKLLALESTGWKDIHATRRGGPTSNDTLPLATYLRAAYRAHVKHRVPLWISKLRKSMRP
jgi:FkbM family methyltransferase